MPDESILSITHHPHVLHTTPHHTTYKYFALFRYSYCFPPPHPIPTTKHESTSPHTLLSPIIMSTGNFSRDFIVAIAAAASATIAFTILICVCAQCGPNLLGRVSVGENWFQPGKKDEKRDLPFVQSSKTLTPGEYV
ncbi:uncharacterized protein BCR38DRAFT_485647 [Pseudomassariella vexata]|uniref:Uncharacterized protein n=1 Tax=Pseudomassariella vexata TaxID=1141098 RepID=A0A1Y2DZ44_9PEZI|nr:uncharacterized protein BCR38DRAFT_485647 [Pseudomassariella vexata]ORY64499.1 hypothetical protein BCR38DRAFT_485647 [Pseudomassariella vexata]